MSISLRPSSAHIWGAPGGCSAHAAVQTKYPEESKSEAAEQGTTAHWIGEHLILAHSDGEAFKGLMLDWVERTPDQVRELLGNVCPDTQMVLTDDLITSATVYARYVVNLCHKSYCAGSTVAIEQKYSCPSIGDDNGGTPDFAIFTGGADNTLHIIDFKNGRRMVEAFENRQLLNYMLAFLDNNPHIPRDTKVRITIVQPNAYHDLGMIRHWDINLVAVAPIIMEMQEGARNSRLIDAEQRVGEHCKFCNGRANCEALRKASHEALEIVAHTTLKDMPDDYIGLEYTVLTEALQVLDYRATALAEKMKSRIRSGHKVAGYEMRGGAGSTVWDVPASQVIALGTMLGQPLAKSAEAITPTQALKLPIPDGMLDKMIKTTPGKTKLTKSSNNARSIFGH